MGISSIILLVFVFLGLRVDYKRDEGLHKKAKLIHAIILIVLMFVFSGSLRDIWWVLGDFENGLKVLTENTGVINRFVYFGVFLVDAFLSTYAIFITVRLFGRRRKQIAYLKYVLVILVVTHSVLLYSSVLKIDDTGEIGFFVSFIFGLFFFGLPTLAIIKIYNAKFMKDFFEIGDFANIDEN